MVVETEFDGLLEDDIILEETDETSSYEEVLKNTENLLKSYLYIKKIVNSSSPFVNAVIKAETVDTTASRTEYVTNQDTGLVLIKNIDTVQNFSIFINDGEFVLFPYESIEIPTAGIVKLETKGTFSILESKYGI